MKTEAGVRQVRGDRQRHLRPGARIRRRALRRARRRPRAQPVHGEDVRARALRGVPHDQADVRSARHLQPRQDRRRAAADGATCASAPSTRRRIRSPSSTTRPRRHGRRGRDVQRPRRVPQDARRHDVPVVHGDARGAALDARPRQRAAPDDGRPARRIRPRRSPASTTRSICASSAARARPNARSASTSPASRASSSPTTGSATARRSRRACSATHRARGVGQPARAAVELGRRSAPARRLNERLLGIDRRRRLPQFQRRTLRAPWRQPAPEPRTRCSSTTPSPTTTTRRSALPRSSARSAPVFAPALAPQPLLRPAADFEGPARRGPRPGGAEHRSAVSPTPPPAGRIVFCEPSCLSAVREDAPALLRGESRRQAEAVASVSVLFEEFAAPLVGAPAAEAGPGLDPAARPLSSEVDGAGGAREGAAVPASRRDAWSISMPAAAAWRARSATRATTTTSRAPSANASCFPAVRSKADGSVVVAAGTSCRHQIADFTGETAVHPAVLLGLLLQVHARADDDTRDIAPSLSGLSGVTNDLAWLSLGALVVAMIVSCYDAQRRRARAGAGLDRRRLSRRHEPRRRARAAFRCSCS